MSEPSLFDSLWGGGSSPENVWTPPQPPSLDGIHDIELNVETTGLRWWQKDRPLSISIALPGEKTYYLPWGHRGGGNLDEATVKRWAQRELRGKRITNINTRFDIHMLREWGVDLEAQGNEVSDVAHYAALLDDHRLQNSLDVLIPEFIGPIEVQRLDESRMEYYHAGEAANRSEYNVKSVQRLRQRMWPMLNEQDLHPVRALEDKVIYVVCEMEKNGSPIDLDLLDRYIKRIKTETNNLLIEIANEAGFPVNPSSPGDKRRVFEKLGLSLSKTINGAPSFSDSIMKRVEHPLIKKIRRASKLLSLQSKYITRKKLSPDGIFRYALHQLRAQKDANDDHAVGTVSGRFSSTEIAHGEGDNIQNRMKAAKQRVSFGYDEDDDSHDEEIYLVRKLHVPASGLWLSADMMQVEYRMFASYAGNPDVIKAYQDDPELSFHKYVHALLKEHIPTITYRKCKDCNFAKVYGAGIVKLALMLELITAEEYESLKETKANKNHPLLAEANRIESIYNRVLPEVGPLQAQSRHIAMPACGQYCNPRDAMHQKLPHRGYVRTIMGRRSRFPNGWRIHKALNAVIQGGAADVMKQKLVELHEARFETGFLLRATVHDEVDGDIPDLEAARKVRAILNRQSFPEIKIPLLWEVETGRNWADGEKLVA